MQIVAHNLASMFTQRELKLNTTGKTKSTEKLSSGYKINRSADDASGLAISEKMRKQIRGLDRGATNIMDGISVCQIADGALAEVTDILQRVRVLTIQAYNGTNSESDKESIQDEVEEALTEIDGISERTKFNELYILQGGSLDVGKTEEVMIATDDRIIESHRIVKPDWLDIDSSFTYHSQYNFNLQNTGDGVMRETRASGNIYYGKKGALNEAGYTWSGDVASAAYKKNGWTSTISDNMNARVDFGKLVDMTTPQQLHDSLQGLVGVQMVFPCASCYSNVQGVQFTGKLDQYTVTPGNFSSSGYSSVTAGEINITQKPLSYNGANYTGYLDLIDSLEGKSEDEVKACAKFIASDLVGDVYDKLSDAFTQSQHFDRVARTDEDPYAVYVYDFRDKELLQTLSGISSRSTYNTTTVNIVTDKTGSVKGSRIREAGGDLDIHASANAEDKIFLELPTITRKALNLQDYDVRSDYIERTPVLAYSDKYLKALEEWKAHPYDVTYTEEEREFTSRPFLGYKEEWVNGEKR